jgi:hypothetical protein
MRPISRGCVLVLEGAGKEWQGDVWNECFCFADSLCLSRRRFSFPRLWDPHPRMLLLKRLINPATSARALPKPHLAFFRPLSSTSLRHRPRLLAKHLSRPLSLSQPRRSMVTIDPSASYVPHAPSPFITSSGSALDNLLDGYELVPAENGLPAYAIFTKPVEQSLNDDRLYRCVPLSLSPPSASGPPWTCRCWRLPY